MKRIGAFEEITKAVKHPNEYITIVLSVIFKFRRGTAIRAMLFMKRPIKLNNIITDKVFKILRVHAYDDAENVCNKEKFLPNFFTKTLLELRRILVYDV